MKKTAMPGAVPRARRLRGTPTDAEKTLWRILSRRQLDGHRFRRQVPIGRYIADFVCHEARLIVEVDGGHHDPGDAEEQERQAFLEAEGYRVLRFWNNEVLGNLAGVHAAIRQALPADHPLPGPPPPRERET